MGLTVSGHSQSETFLQAAMLAAVPVGSVNEAVPLTGAGVGCVVLLTPSEESLVKCQPRRRIQTYSQTRQDTRDWAHLEWHNILHVPCIPHTWWLHSGYLRICLRRFCMVLLRFGLWAKAEDRIDVGYKTQPCTYWSCMFHFWYLTCFLCHRLVWGYKTWLAGQPVWGLVVYVFVIATPQGHSDTCTSLWCDKWDPEDCVHAQTQARTCCLCRRDPCRSARSSIMRKVTSQKDIAFSPTRCDLQPF